LIAIRFRNPLSLFLGESVFFVAEVYDPAACLFAEHVAERAAHHGGSVAAEHAAAAAALVSGFGVIGWLVHGFVPSLSLWSISADGKNMRPRVIA
jgi:hypothetical protein